MSTLSYCAEVLRSVKDRGLNLTHGWIICLDVKMACRDVFGTLLLDESQQYLPSRMQRIGRI
jgi:hypothetical protein